MLTKTLDIPRERMFSQHISRARFRNPAKEVAWLAAVQSQDYGAAKWALGLRLKGVKDLDVERAFNEGSILRTHVLRPTWHFVSPEDIRWMLALSAPRVHAANALYYRRLEIDSAVVRRTYDSLGRALHGGKTLAREEIRRVIRGAGVPADGPLRLPYLLMRAELDGLITSGPRRGKQFTYALLDDRVPARPPMAREDALAELSGRYFRSHGPATVHDFAKWSGLAAAEARTGLNMVRGRLQERVVNGHSFWSTVHRLPAPRNAATAHLLPNYDEYTIGYRDPTEVFDPANLDRLVFNHILLLQGKVAGTWRRTLTRDSVRIETKPFRRLIEAERAAVTAAARRYAAFLGVSVSLA